jgi:hypothetical protein
MWACRKTCSGQRPLGDDRGYRATRMTDANDSATKGTKGRQKGTCKIIRPNNDDEVDWTGIVAGRDTKSSQPAQPLIFFVRRRRETSDAHQRDMPVR